MSKTSITRNRCQGTSRQSGKPCKLSPVEGREFCRFHGGHTLTGPNHPNWKGGRYAKSAPNRYLRAVTAALEDPQLTSLRESIALIDARLVEELQGLDETGSRETWDELRALSLQLEVAIESGDDDRVSDTGMSICALIRDGSAAEEKWDSVMATIERRARISEKERARERDQKAYMTADQVLEFTTRVTEIVAELVDDRRKFQIFLDRMSSTPAVARLPGKKDEKEPIEAEIVQ